MPVKPPDAGAAEDPLGQHAVGIGLLEASCVGALIARREPNLLVSLDRRCISHCRTRCLVQAGRLIIQAGQLLVSADRLLNEGGCLRAVEARSPRRRDQNETQKGRPHRHPDRAIPFSSSPKAIIAEFSRAARRRHQNSGKVGKFSCVCGLIRPASAMLLRY